MRNFRYNILLAITFPLAAWGQSQHGDVILQAMQDELNRNMNELRLPNHEKPFFIMYNVQDQKTYDITATLGSIVQSSERPARFKSNTRILVGDYAFNDESLDDNSTSTPSALEISLPIDADYLGIRRALWSSTDKVYRDAARHFSKHQQTLKESGKSLDEIPHRSFASGKPIELISTVESYAFDRPAWESTLKDLSSIFLKHPAILYSGVVIQFSEGHNYMVNSEGVVAKVPFRRASLIVIAQGKNEAGEFVVDQVIHETRTPDKLPSTDKLKIEIEKMISAISEQLTLPKLEDEYNGPVLLEGSAVAGVFSTVLFEGTETVFASNFVPKISGFQYSGNNPGMDNKIGKSVMNESITIKAKPILKSYNSTELFGAFDIDDEGMRPADELIIVENGVLRNLLNDRTITNVDQRANGFSSGPGVVEVTTTFKNTEKELKERLLAAAKSEGLDHALIIRQSPLLMGVVNVYKVSVSDGKEELLRNALLSEVTFRTLRRVLGASGNYHAHNLNTSKFLGPGAGGPPISYIVPEAVLVESLDVKPFEIPTLKEEEFVSNPLLGIK
jgi:PmbA/TldA metallopeptidase C-terminal domain